jgi:hypothetical protein
MLVVGAVVVSAYYYFAARSELATAVADTARLDPGWRFEELEAHRRLPPAEHNAALQVLKAASLLPVPWPARPDDPEEEEVHTGAEVLWRLPPERQLDERQARRLRADLEQARPALDPARKLADMPEGRYPVVWAADVTFTRCPWSDAIHATPALLELDAVLRSEDGDPDAALTSTRALVNVGRSLGDEPFFGAALSRSVCRRNAVLAVERAVAQGRPSEKALAAVQESLAREDALPLPLLYFRGERALMHDFLTRVDAGQHRISEMGCTPTRGLGAHAETWLGRPHALHKHARYLRDMNEAVEIAKLPLGRQYPLYREWRRRKGYVENVGDGFTLGGALEDILLHDHALLRSGLAAVAAERYRLGHGDWPRALADLVPAYLPAVPLDPFDGQPLRYRRTDGGAVVYSVGEDGRDDGGDLSPPPHGYLPRDVVLTLWDVAGRRQPPEPPADGKRESGQQ